VLLENERQLLIRISALTDGVLSGVRGLLMDPQLISLTKEYDTNKAKRVIDVGLNLFALISEIYHQENFHSDILCIFLDPASPHKEGYKYLHLFIEFLRRRKHSLNLAISEFRDVVVAREENRIDLLIRDETSKKAIIVENKMNNAGDQDRQLPRYLSKVKQAGYECEAIVYLRLNRIQYPDTTNWTLDEEKEIDAKLICVTAYMDSADDLSNGWIQRCEQVSEHIDALLILRQYGTLIRKLGGDVMNKPLMDEFYKMMLKDDNLKSAQSVASMLDDLILYRVQMLIDRFGGDLEPFKRIKNYQDYVAYFEGLTWNEANVGFDIVVEPNGYILQVWDRNDFEAAEGRAKSILESLAHFEEFTLHSGRYAKSFEFPAQEQFLIEYVTAFKKELAGLTKTGTA
jgi:hypothetical protein